MKRSSKTSGSGSLICPFCEVGELERKGSVSARCTSCGKVLGWSILEDLRQLIALPEKPGHPRLRVRASRDAWSARRGVPLPGVRLGDSALDPWDGTARTDWEKHKFFTN
jgi:hypothetical protein